MGLEKPSLEPRKSLGEEGLQRGPDALGPAYREDEEEDEEEEEQTDPKKPTTDEVRPASGMRGRRDEGAAACLHFPSGLGPDCARHSPECQVRLPSQSSHAGCVWSAGGS